MRQLRRVHIAHKKHLNSPSQQVSWNSDASRQDRHTFSDHFKGIEKAKEIARTTLKLNDDTVLESVNDTREAQLLVEAVAGDSAFSTAELLEMPVLVLKRKSVTLLKRALKKLEEMEYDEDTRKRRGIRDRSE